MGRRPDYAVAILVGGAALAGIAWMLAWLIDKALPFADVRLGGTAAMVRFIVGGAGAYLLYAMAVDGRRETLTMLRTYGIILAAFLLSPVLRRAADSQINLLETRGDGDRKCVYPIPKAGWGCHSTHQGGEAKVQS